MNTSKTIEGGPSSKLCIKKSPIIFNAPESQTNSKATTFVFKEVNFLAEDLETMFVLQNKNGDLTLIFEDCHFKPKE